LQLQKKFGRKIKVIGKSQYGRTKSSRLPLHSAIIEVTKVEELLQKSSVTAYKLLADLERLDIIKEI
jgi:hypothetical protein